MTTYKEQKYHVYSQTNDTSTKRERNINPRYLFLYITVLTSNRFERKLGNRVISTLTHGLWLAAILFDTDEFMKNPTFVDSKTEIVGETHLIRV